MPINDMVPLAQNVYGFSLQFIPFQHQSGERSKGNFFCFGLPGFNMAAQATASRR